MNASLSMTKYSVISYRETSWLWFLVQMSVVCHPAQDNRQILDVSNSKRVHFGDIYYSSKKSNGEAIYIVLLIRVTVNKINFPVT